MNLRMTFCLVITLFLTSTVNITPSFAQASPQWDLPEGVRARLGKGNINEIAYSPDGSRLAVGGSIGIWVYDAQSGAEVALIGAHTSWVDSVSFSPDGTTIASGSGDNTVRLWDAATSTALRTLTGHTGSVESVVFSLDGTTLASGSDDNTVRLWDAATRTLKRTLQHTDRVKSVVFSPDGTTLASGSGDETVRLWDAATGTSLRTLTGHTDWVYSVAFSPDGTTLASGSWDGTVLLWRLTPTSTTITFNPPTVADQTFTIGTSVSLTLPTATGGTAPYTYTLSPIPAGLQFDTATQLLTGTPTTATPPTRTTYTATDATGRTASLTFMITVELNLDVNGDGTVDVLDLIWVAVSYQMRGPAVPADVTADGVVNVQDLVAVANAIDAAAVLPANVAEEVALAAEAAAKFKRAAGAPMMQFNKRSAVVSGLTTHRNVATTLADAKTLGMGDVQLEKWLPLLEVLLQVIAEVQAIPETTALLPNYPNPFNPETWIPYHLSTSAEVTLSIYTVDGRLVRTLNLGHQLAGVYESRERAVYWDGKNQLGEPVASGLYFYTLSTQSTRNSLTAGEFNATRKLFIAK